MVARAWVVGANYPVKRAGMVSENWLFVNHDKR